jgi:1,4-dihydroxy-2-naphthoate polyprenyltransferase
VCQGTNCERVRALWAFVRLSRPLFLYGGFAGVALGAAVAAWSGHRLDAATYAWVQVLVTAFHLMVHYANDYFDRHGDRGAARTAWSGGSGVLGGDLAPGVALAAALVCAAAGLLATARFAFAGNVPVALLGLAIAGFAWWYSAPPLRLAARGLGELDAALVVGILVPCTAYAAFAGRVDGEIVRSSLVCALAMLGMMIAVEVPDRAADAAAGKRNWVVRFGESAGRLALAGTGVATALNLALTGLRVAPDPRPLFAIVVPGVVAMVVAFEARTARPALVAFAGVALYAATVTGLAALYAVTAR